LNVLCTVVVPSSIGIGRGIGRGSGIPMNAGFSFHFMQHYIVCVTVAHRLICVLVVVRVACVAAAKAPGEPRRVNAPSLAMCDLGISEPVGSTNQQSTARVSPNQMSPAMRVPPNRSLAATSTNQQAGGGPLGAPPGFDIANNVTKLSVGRRPMSQCITPSGIAKG
jgi:hypothetical protein